MRKFRTEEEWSILIAQYDSSGLTIKNFCKQHSIGCSSFYVQRKKLLQSEQSSDVSGFVQAVVKETAAPPITEKSVETITLTLNQCTVTLPTSTSAIYLASLLRALK